MAVFNEALIGKQAWRLIAHPNSLFSRVMKGKYYLHSDFLNASVGLNGSYSWRGIWGSKSLVKEGLIWRVGDGSKIKAFSDPWVADKCGRFLQTPCVEGITWVKKLMDDNGHDWDYSLISSKLCKRDVDCIMAIPLSCRAPSDCLTWAFTKDGIYSVKTAYMLGKSCNLEAFHKVWVDIWGLDTIPKVKLFLWRLCTGTLPTRELMHRRHMLETDCCPWCAYCTKSVNHALFLCPAVSDLWRECECEELVAGDPLADFKEVIASWDKVRSRKRLVGVTLLWYIWSCRNNKIFNNKDVPHTVVRDRVMRLVEDCGKYTTKIYGQVKARVKRSPKVWIPPPTDFFKVNCDACLKDEGWVGLGAVIRDSSGEVRHAATQRNRGRWPPEIAECKAIAFGVGLAKRYGFKKVIVELDSKIVVDRLSKCATYFSDLDSILDDVFFICKDLEFVSCLMLEGMRIQ